MIIVDFLFWSLTLKFNKFLSFNGFDWIRYKLSTYFQIHLSIISVLQVWSFLPSISPLVSRLVLYSAALVNIQKQNLLERKTKCSNFCDYRIYVCCFQLIYTIFLFFLQKMLWLINVDLLSFFINKNYY